MPLKSGKRGSMAAHNTHIFAPTSLQELFSALKSFPKAVFWAGGTQLLYGQGDRLLCLPQTVINLNGINELKEISRTERYIEVGAMASLGRLQKLEKILPAIIVEAISTVASVQIRNLASLGGNLACQERRMDLFAPLCTLDALLELRSAGSSRWVPISRFAPSAGPTIRNADEIITRVRIPLETWTHHRCHKLGPVNWISPESAVFAFLARTNKDSIGDVRMVLAGSGIIRDRELENQLAGKTVPLSRRDIGLWVDQLGNLVDSQDYPSSFMRSQFLSLAEDSLQGLS